MSKYGSISPNPLLWHHSSMKLLEAGNLRDRDLKREGCFVGEGRFTVERMLESGWDIEWIVCSEGLYPEFEEKGKGVSRVFVFPLEELERIAGYPFHRGVLALGRRPVFPSLQSFLADRGRNGTLVVCPEINEQENLGSIIRSAAAFGAAGVVLGPRGGDPLSRRVIKVSVGTVFRVPIVQMEDDRAGLQLLKAGGYSLIAAIPDEAAVSIGKYAGTGRDAVVLGNEAGGLPENLAGLCTHKVTVPISSKVDSLNVSVAAAIFLFYLQT